MAHTFHIPHSITIDIDFMSFPETSPYTSKQVATSATDRLGMEDAEKKNQNPSRSPQADTLRPILHGDGSDATPPPAAATPACILPCPGRPGCSRVLASVSGS